MLPSSIKCYQFLVKELKKEMKVTLVFSGVFPDGSLIELESIHKTAKGLFLPDQLRALRNNGGFSYSPDMNEFRPAFMNKSEWLQDSRSAGEI